MVTSSRPTDLVDTRRRGPLRAASTTRPAHPADRADPTDADRSAGIRHRAASLVHTRQLHAQHLTPEARRPAATHPRTASPTQTQRPTTGRTHAAGRVGPAASLVHGHTTDRTPAASRTLRATGPAARTAGSGIGTAPAADSRRPDPGSVHACHHCTDRADRIVRRADTTARATEPLHPSGRTATGSVRPDGRAGQPFGRELDALRRAPGPSGACHRPSVPARAGPARRGPVRLRPLLPGPTGARPAHFSPTGARPIPFARPGDRRVGSRPSGTCSAHPGPTDGRPLRPRPTDTRRNRSTSLVHFSPTNRQPLRSRPTDTRRIRSACLVRSGSTGDRLVCFGPVGAGRSRFLLGGG